MKMKSMFAMAVAGFMLTAVSVFAEEETKTLVDVSGKIFMDYSYLVQNKDKTSGSKTKNQDSFNLTRAYVNFDKKIDDAWSAKVTFDAGNLDQAGTDKSTKAATSTKSSAAYVKNAYGQFKKGFDVVDLKVQAGLVGTPVIDLLDGVIGSRWIYQNYIDKSSDLNGSSLDASSADTGVKAEVKVMKMVSLTGMYSNGDGYKVNTSADQDKTTKSYYGTLNINPVEALNIFGYYHEHDNAVQTAVADGTSNKKDNYMSYYGFGAAWKDKSVKVGAAYTIGAGKNAALKETSSVLEAWANVNLNEFIGAPVLVLGRYAYGTYEKKAPSTTGTGKLKNEGSSIWGGVGYQINKNVQIAAMYNVSATNTKKDGVKQTDVENNTFYVKSEVVF